ncbi:MAG: hypothetical protein ACTSQY_00725 [Candidatus Odinarchaeia archaeon]
MKVIMLATIILETEFSDDTSREEIEKELYEQLKNEICKDKEIDYIEYVVRLEGDKDWDDQL